MVPFPLILRDPLTKISRKLFDGEYLRNNTIYKYILTMKQLTTYSSV